MNKKFYVAGIVAAVFVFVFEFLVHGVALMGTYEATANVWRPLAQMESIWWFSMLIQIATAFAMACYASKQKVKGHVAGISFGAMIGVFYAIMSLGQYAFLPIEFTLAVIWALAVWIKMTIIGAIVGHIYR